MEYFTRANFGRSQFLAGLLLLAFFVQSLWLVRQQLAAPHLDANQAFRLQEGLRQWKHGAIAGTPVPLSVSTNASLAAAPQPELLESEPITANDGYDAEHAPLWYLIEAAPVAAWSQIPSPDSRAFLLWSWLVHLPFLLCGALMGASLWYVGRRLCGNAGGFVALTLYCFSPAMIQAAALWHTEPAIIAVWGAFGAVFTAIAVAHTLYAPREVVLWNWRRIVLLAISLTLAIGSQFSMIVLLPIALAFLLYVAPVRRGAGTVVWLAACFLFLFLFFAAYFFRAGVFWQSLRHAALWSVSWRGFTVLGVYKEVAIQIGHACPALLLIVPVVVATYIVWPRARYFGNTAPLLVALLFIALAIAHPHEGGAGFLSAGVPFIFLFVSGVLADLMETRYRSLISAGIVGLLIAYVLWGVVSLSAAPQG